MTANQRQLEETLQALAGEARRLTCAQALQVAHDLGLAPAVVGQACNDLGIKLRECQLGCF